VQKRQKEVIDPLPKDSPKISFNAQKKCKKLDAFFGETKEEEKKE